jgi:hypothetical protein
MKLYETKKLHYNKYLYKLVIPNGCASYFRTEFQTDGQLGYARQKLDTINQYYNANLEFIQIPWGSGGRFYDTIAKDHYFDAIEIFRHLKNTTSEYKVRCEAYTLVIYSNEKKFLTSLVNKLKHPHLEFWEPNAEQMNFLLDNKNIILVNSKPKYEFKIVFGKKAGSPSLAKWIDNNPKLAKIGEVALQECYNNGWVKGYYFFVRDAKTLTIAQMIVGDNIQSVYRLVHSDK